MRLFLVSILFKQKRYLIQLEKGKKIIFYFSKENEYSSKERMDIYLSDDWALKLIYLREDSILFKDMLFIFVKVLSR